MKILVLGGGQQGRVVATDLARSLSHAHVTVADIGPVSTASLPNLESVQADLGSVDAMAAMMRGFDLAVGALPSRLGPATFRAAIEAKRNLVDVSFSAEDAVPIEGAARSAGIFILPDCGLAPGLSSLLCGQAAARHAPRELSIYVGGVDQDPARPYGYNVTWSLDDLLEEYTRPARIVRAGERVTVPVFSGMERIHVEGAGEFEAFYSDGLRTLMDTLPGIPDMEEKTLRWPGHAEAVQPLLRKGTLVSELREKCTTTEPRDLVAMVVRVRGAGGTYRATLVSRAAHGMSAMARTTALTCSAVAQLAASGGVKGTGVLPLERIAADESATEFLFERLGIHGVAPTWRAEG